MIFENFTFNFENLANLVFNSVCRFIQYLKILSQRDHAVRKRVIATGNEN